MAIDKELLDILVCPETKQQLKLASDDLLTKLNVRISKEEIVKKNGERLTEPLKSALLRSDGEVLYPVLNDIPILLIEEGIEMARQIQTQLPKQ